MAQEPKKRHSRQRQGKRRASIKLASTQTALCSNCGAARLSHRICSACGYYKGEQVVKPKQRTQQAA